LVENCPQCFYITLMLIVPTPTIDLVIIVIWFSWICYYTIVLCTYLKCDLVAILLVPPSLFKLIIAPAYDRVSHGHGTVVCLPTLDCEPKRAVHELWSGSLVRGVDAPAEQDKVESDPTGVLLTCRSWYPHQNVHFFNPTLYSPRRIIRRNSSGRISVIFLLPRDITFSIHVRSYAMEEYFVN